MIRKRPEEDLHRQVADYLSLAIVPPAWWTTFPSGWFRGKAAAGILKACGLKAGVPDILLIRDGRVYWIELKAEGGYLSAAQKEMRPLLLAAGCQHVICRSIGEIQSALLMWGFRLKARAA